MTLIGVVGDVHGNPASIEVALRLLHKENVEKIVQVGDFGFWPGDFGQAYLSTVSRVLKKNGQTLTVVPGNHEDYKQILALPGYKDGELAQARPHLWVAPRGYRWEEDGVSFVALGGAPSVDRAWRLQSQRRSQFPVWWAEEAITQEDVDRTVEGGYADVMFAHDAPWGVPQIERHIFGNPLGFADADLSYALEGRRLMLEAVTGVAPKMFFHGHYHKVIRDNLLLHSGETVKIRGLNSDGGYGTCGILDLKDLSFTHLG